MPVRAIRSRIASVGLGITSEPQSTVGLDPGCAVALIVYVIIVRVEPRLNSAELIECLAPHFYPRIGVRHLEIENGNALANIVLGIVIAYSHLIAYVSSPIL